MITFYKWKRALRPFRFPLKGTLHWREYISPHLGQINQPIGLYTTPHIWGNQTLHEVNIFKEPLLNIILNADCQIYFKNIFTTINHK